MKREPVAKVEIVRLVALVITLLVARGAVTAEEGNILLDNIDAVAFIVLALVSIGGSYFARQRVTPVADPRGVDGSPLVIQGKPQKVNK